MFKKIIIALLVVTLVGAAAVALIDQRGAISVDASPSGIQEAAPQIVDSAPIVPSAAVVPGVVPTETVQQPAVQPETTQPIVTAVSTVGDVWSGSGEILELSAVGMRLALTDGSDVFVELGPVDFWQSQGTLLPGADVVVDGFFNGTDYHVRAVTTSNGIVITMRDSSGRPLWAGGVNSSAGENGGLGEVQIPADEWVMVDGTVTALTNNGLTLLTPDGETMMVSFGRADFWQQQSVTFAAGDQISMQGFWQADQFTPAQVIKSETGERILLRDPNGRPLWAGPGRSQGTNSDGNGQGGNAGNGQGGNVGSGNQGSGSADSSTGSNSGNGDRYGAGGTGGNGSGNRHGSNQ